MNEWMNVLANVKWHGLSIICCCRWFSRRGVPTAALNKTSVTHNSCPGLANLLVNIKELLILRHQISSQNPPKTTNGCSQTLLFHFFRKTNRVYFLWWGEEGGLEFPATGAECGSALFPQGAPSSSLTVCLCGSSKSLCWRKSTFTWAVWSELEGFPPRGPQSWRYRGRVLLSLHFHSGFTAEPHYASKD